LEILFLLAAPMVLLGPNLGSIAGHYSGPVYDAGLFLVLVIYIIIEIALIGGAVRLFRYFAGI
jgi:hypothetical protein